MLSFHGGVSCFNRQAEHLHRNSIFENERHAEHFDREFHHLNEIGRSMVEAWTKRDLLHQLPLQPDQLRLGDFCIVTCLHQPI
jgi:hypothetical protein